MVRRFLSTDYRRRRRHARVRAKIKSTARRPRLVVFRSNKYIYAQLVDDLAQRTLTAVSDSGLASAKNKSEKLTKAARSFLVGERLAKQALTKQIKQVVFDRGGYAFRGRVKALAEGARKGGLEF